MLFLSDLFFDIIVLKPSVIRNFPIKYITRGFTQKNTEFIWGRDVRVIFGQCLTRGPNFEKDSDIRPMTDMRLSVTGSEGNP